MTEHDLKVWPEYFAALLDGSKPFEVRKDDRGYAVGDTLLLREWDPEKRKQTSIALERPFYTGEQWSALFSHADEAAYTGRAVRRRITYILRGGPWLTEGYVVLGLAREDVATEAEQASIAEEDKGVPGRDYRLSDRGASFKSFLPGLPPTDKSKETRG